MGWTRPTEVKLQFSTHKNTDFVSILHYNAVFCMFVLTWFRLFCIAICINILFAPQFGSFFALPYVV